MQNAISLQILGKSNIERLDTAYQRELQRHNKEVYNSRYILSKIVSAKDFVVYVK
jgi:hypothetical protein